MSEERKNKTYSALEVVLIVCVLFIPLTLAFLLCLFQMAVVLLLGLFLLGSVLALGIWGIFELVFGVVMVGIGVEKLFSMPMGAFSVMGFGIMNIGVALLAECLVIWFLTVAIPTSVKKISGREGKHEAKTEIPV